MAMKQRLRPAFILVILCTIGGGTWLWQTHRTIISDSELVFYGNVDIRDSRCTRCGAAGFKTESNCRVGDAAARD